MAELDKNEPINEEKLEETKENKDVKSEVNKKLKEQIKKSQDKKEGKSRLLEYIKTEHKWENYVMIVVGIAALLIGVLILVGTLTPRSDFWLIGTYPTVVAWILTVGGALLIVYGLYPIYRPTLPEFKKISWLKGKKYWGNALRVFIFLIIFTLLFLLYDSFIQQVLARIM